MTLHYHIYTARQIFTLHCRWVGGLVEQLSRREAGSCTGDSSTRATVPCSPSVIGRGCDFGEEYLNLLLSMIVKRGSQDGILTPWTPLPCVSRASSLELLSLSLFSSCSGVASCLALSLSQWRHPASGLRTGSFQIIVSSLPECTSGAHKSDAAIHPVLSRSRSSAR